MSVYSSTTYLGVLQAKILENRESYGYKAKLAAAAGCQRPYLSQVLRSKAHLTLEHAIRLCRFWQLNPSETQFFIAMINRDRAGTKELVKFFDQQISEIRTSQQQLSTRYAQKSIPLEEQMVYYSHWLYSAVHMLVMVPKFRTARAISERISVSLSLVNKVLIDLERLGFVQKKEDKWLGTRKVMHLASDATFSLLNHQNWRERAVQDSAVAGTDSVHYTAVYSLSQADFERLHKLLLDFMDMTRQIVAPSKEEDVVCLNCDLFKI